MSFSTSRTARAETRPRGGSVLIPLTCHEIRHLLASLREHARRDIGHVLRWSRGDDNIKPEPAHATTDGEQAATPDHELQLPY